MCELPQAWSEPTLRIARSFSRPRKLKTCCECRVQIKPGDCYWDIKGVWDGRGCTFIQCPDCRTVSSAAMAWSPYEDMCVVLGDLIEFFDCNTTEELNEWAEVLGVESRLINQILKIKITYHFFYI